MKVVCSSFADLSYRLSQLASLHFTLTFCCWWQPAATAMWTVAEAHSQSPFPLQQPLIRALVVSTAGHSHRAHTSNARKRSRSGRCTALLSSPLASTSSHTDARQAAEAGQQQQQQRQQQQRGARAGQPSMEERDEEGEDGEDSVEQRRRQDGDEQSDNEEDDEHKQEPEAATAAAGSAAGEESDVEVLSVRRAVSIPPSSAARRLAAARQWEELWRDKQWRLRQLVMERERDHVSVHHQHCPHCLHAMELAVDRATQ